MSSLPKKELRYFAVLNKGPSGGWVPMHTEDGLRLASDWSNKWRLNKDDAETIAFRQAEILSTHYIGAFEVTIERGEKGASNG